MELIGGGGRNDSGSSVVCEWATFRGRVDVPVSGPTVSSQFNLSEPRLNAKGPESPFCGREVL